MSMPQLDDLTKRMRDYEDLKRNGRERTTFRTRAAQLTTSRQQLSICFAIYQAFLHEQIPVQLDQSLVQRLLHQTRLVQQHYQESKTSLIEGDAQLKALFWEPLNQFATTSLRQALVSAWEAHVDAILSPVSTPFLQIFEQIGHYHVAVATLRGLVAEVRQMRNHLPQGEAELAQLAELARNMHHNMGQLPLHELPAAVRTFLEQVVAGTATFEYINEDILLWIRAHHLADSLLITLGTPSRRATL